MKKINRVIVVVALVLVLSSFTHVYAENAVWTNNISKRDFVSLVRNLKVPSKADGYDKLFRPYAKDFFEISVKKNLNPIYVLSLGIEESNYGNSIIAQTKNNLFGLGDYSSYSRFYNSPKDSIGDVCNILREYMTPGTWYYQSILSKGYRPESIEGQMSLYSSDPLKARRLHTLMKKLESAYERNQRLRILGACKKVARKLRNRSAYYCVGTDLIWGDIDRCYKESSAICGATYVSMVLYASGVLTSEQINAYNYHWTGDGGIPSMLEASGSFKQIAPSKMKPGDIVVVPNTHVVVYAGHGKVWDYRACTEKSLHSYDFFNISCKVYRAASIW